MPSAYERLSVIALEAWAMGRPVLANAACKVLVGQCIRSGGGLFYRGYAEFAAALRLLEENPGLRRSLGESGRAYVSRE
jgi:glycosyltransferase involved in cell wall biosynthesis